MRTKEGAPVEPVTRYITCVHCNRACGNLAGGIARLSGMPLCSRPTDGRNDCYRMVMVKFHRLRNCVECCISTTSKE